MSFSDPEHSFAEEVLISGEKIRSEIAGEDVSRHKALTLNSSGEVVQTDDAADFYGVCAYDRVSGQEVAVIQDDCEVKVIGGEAGITEGDALEPDASGDFVQVAAGDEVNQVAVARTSGGDGDVIEAYITDVTGVTSA